MVIDMYWMPLEEGKCEKEIAGMNISLFVSHFYHTSDFIYL